jgi:hypothetical protein
MGFVKAFKLSPMEQLTQPISKPIGLFWLLTALLFLAAFVLFLLRHESWWIIAALAIIISQTLIIISWRDAKFGTIANLIILLPVLVAFMNALPSSFQNVYKTEVQKRLKAITDIPVVSEEDINHLPDPVKKYLHYVGAIGKPRVHNCRVVFKGSMKRTKDSKWMDISSRQYNFFADPARFFYIESALYGIPFDGLHAYAGNSATMQIKVASLFQVANARGEKMNQGENVTMFNDMCFMAPATLIDKNIQWETIDSLTVKARFTNNNITISALLYFNEKGELTNFVSDDRFYCEDGKNYYSYQWSTPVKEYKDLDGRKVPASAEAVWHMPGEDFCYARFYTQEVEYNCLEYK